MKRVRINQLFTRLRLIWLGRARQQVDAEILLKVDI